MRKKQNTPDSIIIHCTLSDFGCAALIRQWHLKRGFDDIGYHNVILNGHVNSGLFIPFMDGAIEIGRPIDGDLHMSENEKGAHALGYNGKSLGICLVGREVFTGKQIESLKNLVNYYRVKFNIHRDKIVGHCELPKVKKTCPNFNLIQFRIDLPEYPWQVF